MKPYPLFLPVPNRSTIFDYLPHGRKKVPQVLVCELISHTSNEHTVLGTASSDGLQNWSVQLMRYLAPEFSTLMSRLDPRNCWHQLSYAIKNQLWARIQSPLLGALECKIPPCPYALKNQRRGLWMPELVLYGIRELVPAIPRILPGHRGGELWTWALYAI